MQWLMVTNWWIGWTSQCFILPYPSKLSFQDGVYSPTQRHGRHLFFFSHLPFHCCWRDETFACSRQDLNITGLPVAQVLNTIQKMFEGGCFLSFILPFFLSSAWFIGLGPVIQTKNCPKRSYFLKHFFWPANCEFNYVFRTEAVAKGTNWGI